MRVVAVDFGSKRIGLAVGDTALAIASPLDTLAATGSLQKDAVAIDAVARREEAQALVVGLPLDEQGDATPMSRICSQLAERLKELQWEVHTLDESMSSLQAESELLYEKASQRRRRRDAAAACVILERFFDGQETA